MTQNTKAKVHTYSLRSLSDFKGKVLEDGFEGMLLDIIMWKSMYSSSDVSMLPTCWLSMEQPACLGKRQKRYCWH